MTEFRLLCLGRPALLIDGAPVKLEMRKSLAMLIYLRIAARPITREFLATLFWPEYDQQHAQANLRRALASLNKSLDDPLLETDREKIGLSDPKRISLDVDRFHDLLISVRGHSHRQGRLCPECLTALEAAERTYQNDFLEGFNLPDCPEFDEWQWNQRETLRRELAGCLEALSRGYADLCEWEKAIQYTRHWTSLDRLDEASQRMLIQLYARTGQRNAALRQFDALTRVLKEELGQPPSEETIALIHQVRAGELEFRVVPPRDKQPFKEAFSTQPLIQTKLYAPPPHTSRVSRPRLLDQLDRAGQYALTLVCAPAGYGKTSLLSEWIQLHQAGDGGGKHLTRLSGTSASRFAWLSQDVADNDSYRFLTYLLAALDKARPGIGGDAQLMLQAIPPLPPQTIVAALVNRLQEQSEPLWLVLDDYQSIDNPEIHESLAFLLEHQPARFHLVVATRANPPLPLHRLRARNQLLELRANDLRFTLEETLAFLNEVMGLALSAEDVATLEQRTEGWIAGLQMAALSMQSREDRSAFVRDFGGSHRYILEYLLEEILYRQPQNTQAFLLQTSILDRLCKPLCDAVLENPEYRQVDLADFERLNLFVTPLDEIGYWYRYHPLFADLLRARLAQSHPDLLPILHLRASHWYEKEGLPIEMIRHALAAKDLERAADLLERFTLDFMDRGEMSTLLRFVQALPRDLVNTHPRLCIQHAMVLTFSGQIGQVEPWLKQAEGHIRVEENSQQAREVRGSAAIIRGLVADFNGDVDTAIRLALEADELLSEDNYQVRSIIPYVLGDGYYAKGQLDQAEQAYEQILKIGRASGNLWVSEEALFKLAQVKKLRCKLRAACDLYQQAIDLAAEKKALHSGSMAATYIGLSDVQREWNQLDSAYQLATKAIQSMEHWPSAIDRVNGYLSLARTAIAQNQMEAAEKAIQMAEENSRKGKLFPITWKNLEACWVRLWLAKGDLAAVQKWVEGQKPEEIAALFAEKPNTIAELEGVTLARAYIALGGGWLDKAVQLLYRLAEVSRSAGQTALLIETDVLLAMAYQARGEPEAALKLLGEGLALSQPEGYLRQYLNDGEPMRRLLKMYQTQAGGLSGENQRLCSYIRQILDAFPPEQGTLAQTVRVIPAQAAPIESLSSRELEVLELICQGYSNQEIAEKLFVTMNTVKKHNNHVFSKLGVSSRVQVVLQARKLGLVKQDSALPGDSYSTKG